MLGREWHQSGVDRQREAALTALSTEARSKLVKILGLLSSDHDGERAAAGLLATRIIRSAGTDWDQVIQPRAGCQKRSPSEYSPPPIERHGPVCLRHLRRLNQWEQDFVLNLRSSSFLTVAQRQKLTQIAAGLRKAGAE